MPRISIAGNCAIGSRRWVVESSKRLALNVPTASIRVASSADSVAASRKAGRVGLDLAEEDAVSRAGRGEVDLEVGLEVEADAADSLAADVGRRFRDRPRTRLAVRVS